MAKKIKISEKEIDEHLEILTRIRPSEDLPTRREVEEMIIRMKLRWGIIPEENR